MATSIAILSRSSFSLTPRCATVSAAVRSATRSFELLVHSLERLLRLLARDHFALQFLVELGERARLAVQLDEDRDLGAEDVWR